MNLRVLRGAAVATIATLLTHLAAYRIAAGNRAQHAHLLEETGHGWIGLLWPAVIVAAAVIVVGSLVVRKPGAGALGAKAIYLASAGAFLAVETVERWAHTGNLDAAAENLLTWQGGLPVLLGLLLLTVVSPLVVRIERVVREKIASLLGQPDMVAGKSTSPAAGDSASHLLVFLTEITGRGPPLRRSSPTTSSL